MHWLLLLCAIAAETIGTTALKASDGFSRLGPSALAVGCFVTALIMLSIVIRVVPVGVTYAIWSGVGIVSISTIGWVMFGQRLDAAAVAGIALIMAGIAVMQLFSQTAGR